jgi:small subunit ribosomal protein S17
MTVQNRGKRRTLQGIVASDKMHKTISVVVVRTFKHAKYGKYIRRRKKYYAHDENNTAKVGDTVQIIESRPLSRLKRWRLVEVVQSAGGEA